MQTSKSHSSADYPFPRHKYSHRGQFQVPHLASLSAETASITPRALTQEMEACRVFLQMRSQQARLYSGSSDAVASEK